MKHSYLLLKNKVHPKVNPSNLSYLPCRFQVTGTSLISFDESAEFGLSQQKKYLISKWFWASSQKIEVKHFYNNSMFVYNLNPSCFLCGAILYIIIIIHKLKLILFVALKLEMHIFALQFLLKQHLL